MHHIYSLYFWQKIESTMTHFVKVIIVFFQLFLRHLFSIRCKSRYIQLLKISYFENKRKISCL